MKVLRYLLFQIIFIFLFFSFTSADANFDVKLDNNYLFDRAGIVSVTEKISVKNKTTEKYLPSFEYKIQNVDIKNLDVSENGRAIPHNISKRENETTIKINFGDKVLGNGKRRDFQINYTIDNIAEKTGDVWEISIPKIEDVASYSEILTKISVPEDFGAEAYFSPSYIRKSHEGDSVVYEFDKNAVSESRIVAAFGQYQVFDYSINYNLKNTSAASKREVVALPPDTSYQRIFYKNLEPKPKNISVDEDGNWIAQYEIPANSEVKVNVGGFVQIFSYPRKYLSPGVMNLYSNIKETNYWQVSDNRIQELSKSLQTPEKVYNFVVGNLKYDFSLTAKDRLGAVEAVTTTDAVTCREFTDLTIALLRASGIPSREVIGYSQSDNPSVKSISFFNDVLHSWVEYWDNDKKLWISIDPTWGATSKSDYFNKFDLRHFAFAIHGQSDSLPYPPGSFTDNRNSKDISVNVGNIENIIEKPIKVEYKTEIFFVLTRQMNITLKNENPFALYDKRIDYISDNKIYAQDNVQIIPPFSTINRSVYSKFSLLGRDTPDKYAVVINGARKEIEGTKLTDMYSQLIIVFLIIASVIVFLLIRIRIPKSKKYD